MSAWFLDSELSTCFMCKLFLQSHHKSKLVLGVASLLLTLDKSALQSLQLVINVTKKDTSKLCVRQKKLRTWKWILMTMIHTWKWIIVFTLKHLQPILQVTLLMKKSIGSYFTLEWQAGAVQNWQRSLIPEVVFKQLQGVTLNPADRCLIGPGKNQLEVLDQFTAKLMHQNSVADEQIYVVKQHKKFLLGRPGILALDLIARIHTLQKVDKFVVRFPKLFQGLGRIQSEYQISLQERAKPFALSTLRRVLLSLIPKVKLELQRMEDMSVIRKVEWLTEWCAGIVVVPKSNGSLWICVDLTKFNASVTR